MKDCGEIGFDRKSRIDVCSALGRRAQEDIRTVFENDYPLK
jgi:hypothetical protein